MRADALFAKFLQTQRDQRLLIATRDDLAAVYAKNAIEMNRRQSDCIIVSQGLDPIMDGGASEKKEIDPNNRGSVVLGSVAYYMDRYGYDVLPLAQSLLAGETLPPRTVTQHILVTAANVSRSCARRRFPPARHQRDRMAYEHATRGFGSPFPLRVNSGCAGQAAARHVNPNKRTPELEQTYLAIRHPLAG